MSLVGSRNDAEAQQPLNPKAAQDFASDSEKAEEGDPEAAYRIGEAFESGRLGGLKDVEKALTFYRLAAQNGHHEAAAKVAELEAALVQSQKHSPPPASSGR
jgi:TPR repeat protein